MATLTSWVEHLTTDVDSATEGMQVAGEIILWWELKDGYS